MAEDKSSYQQVFKATSLFGGVQLIQILISAVKSKVIALFLGPSGMGIFRLLKTTVDLVGQITNFGLPTSAVKFIANAFTKGNDTEAYRLIRIFQKLLWITGSLGGLVLLLGAPLISRLLFASAEYTYPIMWLAVAVLFNQLARGQISILQSLRKLRYLAKANLWGSVWGLILIAPLYYFYGEKAIVPAILITFSINLYFSWYYLRKRKMPHFHIGYRQSISEGKEMLKLGLVLSLSSLLTAVSAYVLQLYINAVGGIDEVGLYSAGFLILNTYGGLIFTAMVKDYYPRLAGIADQEDKVRQTVKEQAFIAILLMTPIIVIFLLLAPQVIQILLSKEFVGIIAMVSWGIIGLLFKAVSWSMSYIIVAKGDSKLFIYSDICFISLQLVMNIVGYYYGGLTGLGLSFLAYYIFYSIGMYLINHWRYRFYLPRDFYLVFGISIFFCGLGLGLSFVKSAWWHYGGMTALAVFATAYSYHQLNKRIDFKALLQNFMQGKNKG